MYYKVFFIKVQTKKKQPSNPNSLNLAERTESQLKGFYMLTNTWEGGHLCVAQHL